MVLFKCSCKQNLQKVSQLEKECALLRSRLEKREHEVKQLKEICEQLRKDLEAKRPNRVCLFLTCHL